MSNMKVVVLQAGKKDQALQDILAKIQEVLEELQVEVKAIQLSQIPYYDGNNVHAVKNILDHIAQATGVIITSRVELLSVSGSLSAFFEHCSAYKGDPLFQKPLFALTASDWRGEREAAEHMLHVWGILGGAEFGKLGVYTPAYEKNQENMLANAERMTESFYRVMKQNRVPIESSDYNSFLTKTEIGFAPVLEKKIAYQTEQPSRPEQRRSTQEKDIQDLANFFKNQLGDEESQKEFIPAPQVAKSKYVISNLPHYFQGQHASDFNAVIQYHVLEGEPYGGYLTIENGDCIFTEGVSPGSEIEISASEEVFKEVFSKKVTSQKAFMLGQLKVRGNFMLLPKIDQMFKPM